MRLKNRVDPGLLSKQHTVRETRFIPIITERNKPSIKDAITVERNKIRLYAPDVKSIVKPSIIHRKGEPTYQTHEENEMMANLNQRERSSPKGKDIDQSHPSKISETLNNEDQKALYQNLHYLLADAPTTVDTCDSSVSLNCYSSVTMDSRDETDSRSGSFSSPKIRPKVPETLHYAAFKDQILLDISKTMKSTDKSLEDLVTPSSLSLDSVSSELNSILSLKESSDVNSNLDVINEEEEMSHGTASTDNNSFLQPLSRTISSIENDDSVNEIALNGMKESFISKLRMAFFDQITTSKDGSRDDDNSDSYLTGCKIAISKDEDTQVTNISTASEPVLNGYHSSGECTSASHTSAPVSNVSFHNKHRTRLKYGNRYARKLQQNRHERRKVISSELKEDKPRPSEDRKDPKDDIFERLHKRGRYMIQQRRELDLQRRISELKRDLALDVQCKKKKAKQRSSRKKDSRQDVNTRLYTRRSLKMNEAGKKLREEIANKNKKRDFERKTGFHL